MSECLYVYADNMKHDNSYSIQVHRKVSGIHCIYIREHIYRFMCVNMRVYARESDVSVGEVHIPLPSH